MKAISTQDVSLLDLEAIRVANAAFVEIELDENRVFFKSADPPSWIALLNTPAGWTVLLGLAAAKVMSGALEEAGRDAWKNRETLAARLRDPTVAVLRTLAESIQTFRQSVRLKSEVDVGIPFPDDFFGTKLRLLERETSGIALELALFAAHMEALSALLSELRESEDPPNGSISLKITDDGALEASWMGRASLEIQTRVIRKSAP